MYQGVVTGISDIGFSHIAYTRGRFPVSEVHNLPLGSPSGYISTHVANDFYAKFRPKEWDDVKVLYLHGSNPQILYTASQAVRKLEDVKGLKIRGGGRIADILKSLGANPVPMEFGEVYEAMRRGVLEGVLGPIEMMKGWKTAEVSKYVTDTHEIGSMDLFFCVMNKDKWNSLPEDIKKTFDQVSAEWIERQGRVWNEIDIEAMEYVKSLKREIIPLSENEVKRWRAAVEPVILDYKKDMEVKGVSQSETETYIQFIKERIEFWKKKETEAGVKSAW
jgi:TRAP-type C4-dicarboxylate transport system substrate-binding protein